MNRNHKALELDKILTMLSEEASSKEARALAMELEPAASIHEAQVLLDETDAAFVLTAKFGAPSFYGLKDVTNAVRRAQAGGGLGMAELLEVASAMRAIRALKQWRQKSEGMKNALDDLFFVLSPNKELEEQIYSAIKSEEEMADNASSALAAIRRKIRNASSGIREKLDRLIRSQTHQKHLQDAIITMRSGRFVVPVKAEFRGEVPGLVHDSSASGATVFIEPMAVVEANNEIRVLQAEERDEISRILAALSAEVGECADAIAIGIQNAVQIDLIFAKAHLAYKMKAIYPKLNDKGRLNLIQARHPLLPKHTVVATNVSLGISFDALIITGPNTGGKTVTLKTIGLITLMAMCGLMIPAEEGSEVSIFQNILVDIGDEQSIEQSLSTFSSHMKNIIDIFSMADDQCLILLDELGAGTDPVEGAALATSIIDRFRELGAKLACTTHYAELKAYALQTPGVENGACEFDVISLRPTYRLLLGVPGKSNAFAILRRLGMAEEIITHAEGLVSQESRAFEQVVGQLEEKRREMEYESEAVSAIRSEAELRIKEALKEKREAEKQAEKEIERARKEAQLIVDKTRRQADAILNELEEIKKSRNKELSAQQKAKLRSGMQSLEGLSNPVKKRKEENYVLPRPLKPGDNVLIYDIDKKAVVLEPERENSVLVQAGIIKTRVDLNNLRLLNEKKVSQSISGGQRRVTKTNVSSRPVTDLDLRGRNAEEALMEVDAAIDSALMSGLKNLTIIHGKGTGVLRSAVQQHLKRNKFVASFRLGTFGEGESGVTIVELK